MNGNRCVAFDLKNLRQSSGERSRHKPFVLSQRNSVEGKHEPANPNLLLKVIRPESASVCRWLFCVKSTPASRSDRFYHGIERVNQAVTEPQTLLSLAVRGEISHSQFFLPYACSIGLKSNRRLRRVSLIAKSVFKSLGGHEEPLRAAQGGRVYFPAPAARAMC